PKQPRRPAYPLIEGGRFDGTLLHSERGRPTEFEPDGIRSFDGPGDSGNLSAGERFDRWRWSFRQDGDAFRSSREGPHEVGVGLVGVCDVVVADGVELREPIRIGRSWRVAD